MYNDNYELVLVHHGVKGMKWGVRRYRNPDGSLTAKGVKRYAQKGYAQDAYNSNKSVAGKIYDKYTGAHKISGKIQYDSSSNKTNKARAEKYLADKEATKAENKGLTDKQKKALKVGAAVVGTALAAYGTYKVASYVQDKRNQAAMAKARDYIDNNFLDNIGQTTFTNGNVRYEYVNKAGTKITMQGARNQVGKAVGRQNAKTIATGRQIYRDATNTRFDRGLAGVVNAGDAVGNTAKRAATSTGNAVKRAATSTGNAVKRAGNAVLDVVKPQYEYVPGSTKSTTKVIDGVKITEGVTEYYKRKKRR